MAIALLFGALLLAVGRGTSSSSGPSSARYNYASESCGAKVLFASEGLTHAGSLLDENKDRYAQVDCSRGDPAWFVVELCQAIRVDAVELHSYELFSSILRDVELLGSFEAPGKGKWSSLANLTLEDTLSAQPFVVDKPLWCRYLKLVAFSHWGSERVCTLSELVVMGSTFVEDLMGAADPAGTRREQQPPQAPQTSAAPAAASLPRSSAAPSSAGLVDPGGDECPPEVEGPQRALNNQAKRLGRVEESVAATAKYAERLAQWWAESHDRLVDAVQEVASGEAADRQLIENVADHLQHLDLRVSSLLGEINAVRLAQQRSFTFQVVLCLAVSLFCVLFTSLVLLCFRPASPPPRRRRTH